MRFLCRVNQVCKANTWSWFNGLLDVEEKLLFTSGFFWLIFKWVLPTYGVYHLPGIIGGACMCMHSVHFGLETLGRNPFLLASPGSENIFLQALSQILAWRHTYSQAFLWRLEWRLTSTFCTVTAASLSARARMNTLLTITDIEDLPQKQKVNHFIIQTFVTINQQVKKFKRSCNVCLIQNCFRVCVKHVLWGDIVHWQTLMDCLWQYNQAWLGTMWQGCPWAWACASCFVGKLFSFLNASTLFFSCSFLAHKCSQEKSALLQQQELNTILWTFNRWYLDKKYMYIHKRIPSLKT